MKVLMINTVCGFGSTGRICTDLADILIKEGHDCKVAYGRYNVPSRFQKYTIKIGNKFDIYMHAFISRFFDNAGFGSKKATQNLIKKIKMYNPNIIHLHNIHGYYINIDVLFRFLKDYNKPVIWTLHDCWAFTGHCSHFDFIGCDKWLTGCYDCSQKKTYPISLFLDRSKQNYRKKRELFTSINNMTIVTPSKWLANLVKESFLNVHKIKVINNGIDINKFSPSTSVLRKKYGIEHKKIVLGVAQNWSGRKGLDDFIKLSKKLSSEYQIVLIGLSEKQLNKMPKSIIGVTKTNSIEELVDWYSTADIFVNTTYEDTFPTVNLEAQACGTPVITYKTGGSPESVPLENIIEVGEMDKLEKKIIDICKLDKTERVCKPIDCFDKKNLYKKYIDLFSSFIENEAKQ